MLARLFCVGLGFGDARTSHARLLVLMHSPLLRQVVFSRLCFGMGSPSDTSEPKTSDQSIFERWRNRFTAMTIGTPEERVAAMQDYHRKRCEKWKGELITYSGYQWFRLPFRPCISRSSGVSPPPSLPGPAVVFMLKHLKQSGADVTSDDIVCAPCDFSRAGGFNPTGVVVLCQDKFMSKGHMEDTMVHELVHMYDHAKFKVNWDNLRHHACSEVCVTSARIYVPAPCPSRTTAVTGC